MGGSKRMSKEEKRKVILEIYHKTKEVYTEKEMIVLASKKGVTSNTVADINNSLVDDALVDKEKIGGSNYFWSFPQKKDRILQLRHEQTLRDIEDMKKKTAEITSRLVDEKRGREDGDGNGDRAKKLARLAELSRERKMAQEELDSIKKNDPQVLEDLKKQLDLVKGAANRWTDNIFNCKSYLVKKRGMDKKEAMKILRITSAFDYPEDKIPK